jgi:hypothetical protein
MWGGGARLKNKSFNFFLFFLRGKNVVFWGGGEERGKQGVTQKGSGGS